MNASLKFEDLMRDHEAQVIGTAVRLLGNETDAQDISQEVFLKAYERLDTLRQRPLTVGAWLRTVTRNLCLNHLSRYRARWCFFSEIGGEGNHPHPTPDIATSDCARKNVDEADRRQVLEIALQKLPSSQRVPLVLYHLEEHSYQEITVKLGVSLNKLKVDLHRGRKALRKKLKLNSHEPLT
jgi:RNA polymerase sigma-70 factor (ECF subfamily)